MSWIASIAGWIFSRVTFGDATSTDHRGNFEAFNAEMWKYVDKLKDDYEKRLDELKELYEKRMADLVSDYEKRMADLEALYEKRMADLVEDYERRLELAAERHSGK